MRIVSRKEFLAMPAYTLHSKYTPCCLSELHIKHDTCDLPTDYFDVSISDCIDCHSTEDMIEKLKLAEKGESIDIDLESMGRDGLYDNDQMYAVWENKDIRRLIIELQKCIRR